MSSIILAASEAAEHAEHAPAVSPYVIGAIALGVLTLMMLGLLSFGKGREHC